jgi:hypothetical protein
MFSECANPVCHAEFDYRQGAIFRFRETSSEGLCGKGYSVKHFWLCRDCAQIYRLEHEKGRVFLSRLAGNAMHARRPHLIAVA